LAKSSFLYINGAKMPFFFAGMQQPVANAAQEWEHLPRLSQQVRHVTHQWRHVM
jgi:hypothetical protein